jgi:hypothetical protein
MVSEPEVALSPDQLPDASQDVALVLLHDISVLLPKNTLAWFVEMLTVAELLLGGASIAGGALSLLEPPQAARNIILVYTMR